VYRGRIQKGSGLIDPWQQSRQRLDPKPRQHGRGSSCRRPRPRFLHLSPEQARWPRQSRRRDLPRWQRRRFLPGRGFFRRSLPPPAPGGSHAASWVRYARSVPHLTGPSRFPPFHHLNPGRFAEPRPPARSMTTGSIAATPARMTTPATKSSTARSSRSLMPPSGAPTHASSLAAPLPKPISSWYYHFLTLCCTK
jgi:hypothetical protein